jgi:putative phage-type endonuclease
MTIHIVEQGSPEWHALRVGKVTASRISDVFARTKTGWGASRKHYKAELVVERLTGKQVEGFMSEDMKNGSILEARARAEYEAYHSNGLTVQQIGFVDHPTIPMAGASADGLVGDDGVAEFKCPKIGTHLEYILNNKIPGEYDKQILWNFACNPTRKWCDFCSYNPHFPPEMQLFRIRVMRDNARIAEAEQGVREFLREVETDFEVLRRTYLGKAAA